MSPEQLKAEYEKVQKEANERAAEAADELVVSKNVEFE
jgi:hypothetical protein